jgi:hypothetical protein
MGADLVEIDVAPTPTGNGVFHDWTVDCRTEGKGEVRAATMAELKQLDPGYGYTADGGKTFPLRGKQKAASRASRTCWRPCFDAFDVQFQEQGPGGSGPAGAGACGGAPRSGEAS